MSLFTAQNFMNDLIRLEEVRTDHLNMNFPLRSQKNDKSAARYLLGVPVDMMNKAWNVRKEGAERKHEPTLQALQKAVKDYLEENPEEKVRVSKFMV